MSLLTQVKINQLTSLHEARYAAGMGVSYIGFNLVQHTHTYISAETQKTLVSWIDGVHLVAEIGNADYTKIAQSAKSYAFDIIETNNWQSAKDVWANTPHGLIFQTHVEADIDFIIDEFSSNKDKFVAIHLLGNEELTEEIMQNISKWAKKIKIFLGVGFDEHNVRAIVAKSKVFGVSLNGSIEEIVGMANFDKNADIIELLEEK